MPTKEEFVSAARTYLGTPWVHQGRNRRGLDCVGLLIVAAAELGLTVPDLKGYRRNPQPDKFLGHIYAHSVHEPDPIPGSFGVFRDGTQPCHVGIFSKRNDSLYFIHAYAPLGKVVEEQFTHDWPQRLVAIRSIEGLE